MTRLACRSFPDRLRQLSHPLLITISLVVMVGGAAFYLVHTPLPSPLDAPGEPRTIEIGGRQRQYIVYVPPSVKAGSGALLAFHGAGESHGGMRRKIGGALERLAREHAFVVVYMGGFEKHFNDCRRSASSSARRLQIDDVEFTRAVIAQLATDYQVDRRRVVAFGFSNGGQMTFRLALEAPELVAGIIAIAASLPAPDHLSCQITPGRHPAVVIVHGTRDPLSPYGGGRVSVFGFGNRGEVLGAEASARWFATQFGGADSATPDVLGEDAGLVAQQQDWNGPAAHVRLITIHGGGHTIPQAGYRYPRFLGWTFRSDAVLESAWQFAQSN